MINPKKAIEIARKHVSDTYVQRVVDAREININIYGVDKSNAWCVFVEPPKQTLALRSAEIILIDKKTGKILYEGSANDEG